MFASESLSIHVDELSTSNLRRLAAYFDPMPRDPFNHRPALLERLLAMEEDLRRFGCPDRKLSEALEAIKPRRAKPADAGLMYAGTLFTTFAPPRRPAA